MQTQMGQVVASCEGPEWSGGSRCHGPWPARNTCSMAALLSAMSENFHPQDRPKFS